MLTRFSRRSATGLLLSGLVTIVSLCVVSGCTSQSNVKEPTASALESSSTSLDTQQRPDRDAPIVEPPVPSAPPENPILRVKLFVDPQSQVMLHANSLRQSDPKIAALLDKIAVQPQALWLGEWQPDIFLTVRKFMERAAAAGAVPVMVLYNLPHRFRSGCYQAGLSEAERYRRWIRDVHAGIGNSAAIIMLEPDALLITHEEGALSEELQKERLFLLNDAIRVLRQNSRTTVYLDAGRAGRIQPAEMAELLKSAGVEHTSGFSLNIGSFRTTEESLSYGAAISRLIGDKHFVIDTSRNGAGPYLEAKNEEERWCNPPGRRLGRLPTTETGTPLCDAFLWLKRPGESDGDCNGGPRAGVFWVDLALEYLK